MSQIVEKRDSDFQQVTLICTVQSSQSPQTFRWYHDNNEVVFVDSKSAISNADRMSTLHIRIDSTSDAGQYWCVSEFADLGTVRSLPATLSLAGGCEMYWKIQHHPHVWFVLRLNKLANCWVSLLLQFASNLQIYILLFAWCSGIDPIQGASSGTINVQEFDQVVLRCPPPPSTPPAIISWLKDSTEVTPSSDGKVGITLDGDLVISGVRVEDTGRHYICSATNPVSMDKVTSSTSVLLVYSNGNCLHCHIKWLLNKLVCAHVSLTFLEQRDSYEPQLFVVQPSGTQSVVLGGMARLQCFTTGGWATTSLLVSHCTWCLVYQLRKAYIATVSWIVELWICYSCFTILVPITHCTVQSLN